MLLASQSCASSPGCAEERAGLNLSIEVKPMSIPGVDGHLPTDLLGAEANVDSAHLTGSQPSARRSQGCQKMEGRKRKED